MTQSSGFLKSNIYFWSLFFVCLFFKCHFYYIIESFLPSWICHRNKRPSLSPVSFVARVCFLKWLFQSDGNDSTRKANISSVCVEGAGSSSFLSIYISILTSRRLCFFFFKRVFKFDSLTEDEVQLHRVRSMTDFTFGKVQPKALWSAPTITAASSWGDYCYCSTMVSNFPTADAYWYALLKRMHKTLKTFLVILWFCDTVEDRVFSAEPTSLRRLEQRPESPFDIDRKVQRVWFVKVGAGSEDKRRPTPPRRKYFPLCVNLSGEILPWASCTCQST